MQRGQWADLTGDSLEFGPIDRLEVTSPEWAGKGLKGERPPLCMCLREVLPALMVLTAAAWALLLIAIFVLAAVVLPIQVPGPRAVYVELQVAKAAAGAVILWAWIYSYLRLRDAVARLLLTPRRSASDRTPP